MKKTLAATALALSFLATGAQAQEFGTDADAEYAGLLWEAMQAVRLVGDDALMSTPYEGGPPHGLMLETFYTTATIQGHSGDLVVKRNYGPEGVAAEEVLSDPAKHLEAITIMFRREAGYDSDNDDWFWVKYLPDGTLDKNPAGMQLAGRVAKGADQGCIACHSGVEGYVFTSSHLNR